MKKIVLLLGLLLSAVTSVSALTAEEVIGKWESNAVKTEPTPEMPMAANEKYIISFQEGDKVDFKNDASMTLELGPGITVDIFVKTEALGTYTVAGDSITVNLDPESVKVVFTQDDIRIRGLEDAAQEEQANQELYANFSQGFNDPAMKEEFAKPQVFNEVLVTGAKMMCKLDDQFITFKRKKK